MGDGRTRYRVGVDIGGTFTDLLVMDRESGAIYPLKTPSTASPERAIVAGLEECRARHGIEPADIEYFSHGTTLAVNTLLEHDGARGGLLTTAGFRDILSEAHYLQQTDWTVFFWICPARITDNVSGSSMRTEAPISDVFAGRAGGDRQECRRPEYAA